MTIDEVRKMNELDMLPNGEGATLQPKKEPQTQPSEFMGEGDSYIVTPIHKNGASSASSGRADSEAH